MGSGTADPLPAFVSLGCLESAPVQSASVSICCLLSAPPQNPSCSFNHLCPEVHSFPSTGTLRDRLSSPCRMSFLFLCPFPVALLLDFVPISV
jgi:hypothetical protein